MCGTTRKYTLVMVVVVIDECEKSVVLLLIYTVHNTN